MNTYTTRTGIKVLLPQVPKGAHSINVWKDSEGPLSTLCYETGHRYRVPTVTKINAFGKLTILGTCWREGGKLICDFDPAQLVDSEHPMPPDSAPGFSDYYFNKTEEEIYLSNLDSWLLSIGEKIKEGHKIVVIKVE